MLKNYFFEINNRGISNEDFHDGKNNSLRADIIQF